MRYLKEIFTPKFVYCKLGHAEVMDMGASQSPTFTEANDSPLAKSVKAGVTIIAMAILGTAVACR